MGPSCRTRLLGPLDGRLPARRTIRADRCGRKADAEFTRCCSIAVGSASELEYHLLLAENLKLIKPKDQRATEVKRMLTALLQKLNADR